MNTFAEPRRQLMELRYEFATVNADIKYGRLLRALNASFKYDPDQPRVPKGNSSGGQWASSEGADDNSAGTTVDELSDVLLVSNKPSAAFCWNQLQIDDLFCNAQFPATRRASCRRQAMERYANCITGKPLPPLNF